MKRCLVSLCIMTCVTGAASADSQTTRSDRPHSAIQHISSQRPVSHPVSRSVEQATDSQSCVKVWVNQQTHVYHMPGSFWYGATPNGRYMCVQQAVASGNTRAFF
ncbi:hypothetical protein [Acetobacter sp.]|uniref:hypothetical protein n=1 Tax=Acetobacter sp. TaxID=440 RepID=UPI0025BC3BEF|nr:hypothetical protein [Acetobacter sp.]MCH4091370.1 hypothetical protein [Acetobacter sp.]MCI1299348.1 hypothetical protein [Acetobacter sp.]MCI1316648.1 hypothetical protein [Acetobacter sp.]